MTILARLVKDRRSGLRWWALGTIIGVATTVALWPTIKGNPDFERVMEELPASVRAMVGSQAGISLTSAPGYLQARLFSTLLPVLMVVYAVSLGAAAIGGGEEDGTLQLVVAAPMSRRRIALERVAASVLLLLALAAIGLITTLLLGMLAGVLDDISAGRLAVATGAVLSLAVFHGGVAFAVGGLVGRGGPAVATAAAVAVAGYLLNAIAATASTVESVRVVSPWWWMLDRNLLVQEPTLMAIGLPCALAVALTVLGVMAFTRRDLRLP